MGARQLAWPGPHWLILVGLLLVGNWLAALQAWLWVWRTDFLVGLVVMALGLVLVGAVLRLSTVIGASIWLISWSLAGPWLLAGVSPLLTFLPLPQLWVLAVWVGVGLSVYLGWWTVSGEPDGLHRARWATRGDTASILAAGLPANGLFLGRDRSSWLVVRPVATRKELGNLLVVGPPRSGKGLLATTQLLSWNYSVVVNDIKGELYNATAGYRANLGPVFVIDPAGFGDRFDPLASRHGEDAIYAAATSLLVDPGEDDGKIFTQRAVTMLASLFGAARARGAAPLPFVRLMVAAGLKDAAATVQSIDPKLATRLLDGPYQSTDFDNRFLLSAWGTLTARLWPLLTENLVKTFNGHDFSASQLLLSPKPVSIYLRWPERDLLALSPLVRLIWDSLIGELITTYDDSQGSGCQPVLLLVDEAGRAPIPTLADHASTVVGREISLWVAIQSLSQLEAIYGKARAQVIRDNMDSQVYYRSTDLATAEYLEKRLGKVSAYAQSATSGPDGEERSLGRSEQAIPLQTAQKLMQVDDETIVVFHRQLPPIKAGRVDWRGERLLESRRLVSPPILTALPAVDEDIATAAAGVPSEVGYIE
jgi:type IV secretion system protein VirD4